jgi:hypothetical protein
MATRSPSENIGVFVELRATSTITVLNISAALLMTSM